MSAIYWGTKVEYGRWSATMGFANTETEARARIAKDAAYLRSTGANITSTTIQWLCAKCDGHGEVFVPGKRNPRIGKNVTCPECGGNARGPEVAVAV